MRWIRDTISKGMIPVVKIHTTENPSDFMTKVEPVFLDCKADFYSLYLEEFVKTCQGVDCC